MKSKLTVAILLPLILATIQFSAYPATPVTSEETHLSLMTHMPRDPLLAIGFDIGDPTELLDAILDMVIKIDPETDREMLDAKMAEMDAELGFSLRNELLAQIGPEIGMVLDLPAIDSIVAAMNNPATAVSNAMAKTGLIMRVRNAKKVDRSLRQLFTKAEAEITEENGLIKVTIVGNDQEPGSTVAMYYGLSKGFLTMAMNPEWVRTSLTPMTEGDRLIDGQDYQHVFEYLEANPIWFSYINLPKVVQMVESSQFLLSMRQSDPEVAAVFNLFMVDDISTMGLGSTGVEVGDGVRTASFGPKGLSGGAMMGGIIAAVAVPNFLNATDRGKQKRTMADLRSLGTAIEAYAIDNNRYPGPTDGWVRVSSIEEALSPVYIRTLPTQDGWGHPVLLWSNGQSYILVSPGKDGAVDREWVGETESGATTDFNADIVFKDGQFWVWPEGTQD